MKKLFLIILLMLPAAEVLAQQEVEVIPYKIENPADNFTLETGMEYAKLITVTSAIKRDIIIYNHEKTLVSLKKLSLNPQRTITENDLIMLGESSTSDYVLLGTLYKTGKNYRSESILYSLKYKVIMSKSHSTAPGLLKLAEAESNEIFFNFPVKKRLSTDNHVDALILTDLSFKIASEWESVRKGIRNFADSISDNWTIDTVINIIPYSDKYSLDSKQLKLNSSKSVETALSKLTPQGDMSRLYFEKALKYSVMEAPWRRNSDRLLILITNSDNIKDNFIERYALNAKAKNISLRSVSMGLISGESSTRLKEFSDIGSGEYAAATYRQRFYNENGNPLDVLWQNGRIFDTIVYDEGWKDGVFQKNSNKQFSKMRMPKSNINELFYNHNQYNITPYNLTKYYPVISGNRIINYSNIENNIDSIMGRFGSEFEYSAGKLKYKKPVARAMITDGTTSLWIKIKDEADLDFFTRREAEINMFPVGINVKKSPDEPYGISLDPNTFITEFSTDYIPDNIKTSLTAVIKNREYYINNGLFSPPVWFIEIKVDKITKYDKDYDIRETNQ